MMRTSVFQHRAITQCCMFVVGGLISMGCERSPEPQLTLEVPANFPAMHYKLSQNPLTQAGFTLGKALFYDGRLSRDGTISCGSCHQQSAAFTHSGHMVSHGIDDKLGTRNTPPIMNLAWQTDFFWDGGVHDLDLQPIAPIENPVEMDEKVSTVLEKLRTDDVYAALFKDAFGTPDITTERFLKALSQFMVTLVSAHSRYDQYVRQEGELLTAEEQAGLVLFQQKCATCHASDLFTDLSYRDNGLDPTGRADQGRYTITLDERDRLRFKVPSLRNVAVTAPYMHDGRFRNLELVLEHYSHRIVENPNLDPLLKPNGTPGLNFTDAEKSNIIAFLKTLTDQNFLTDPRFSEYHPNGTNP